MTLCCTVHVRAPLKDLSIHADRRNVIHPLLSKVALFRHQHAPAKAKSSFWLSWRLKRFSLQAPP
jgi:hypothetical protein